MKIESIRVGDVCNYWNKTVIIHRIGPDPGWADVLNLKNPNVPTQVSGEPFSVRLSHLRIVQRSGSQA